MNMNDIQYIAEIARQGSINKAAKELFVSQPSLSKCIHKIEKEFDIEIFRRSKGSTVKLTEDGGYFVEMAEWRPKSVLRKRWKNTAAAAVPPLYLAPPAREATI